MWSFLKNIFPTCQNVLHKWNLSHRIGAQVISSLYSWLLKLFLYQNCFSSQVLYLDDCASFKVGPLRIQACAHFVSSSDTHFAAKHIIIIILQYIFFFLLVFLCLFSRDSSDWYPIHTFFILTFDWCLHIKDEPFLVHC